jgi:hypothetical protein
MDELLPAFGVIFLKEDAFSALVFVPRMPPRCPALGQASNNRDEEAKALEGSMRRRTRRGPSKRS